MGCVPVHVKGSFFILSPFSVGGLPFKENTEIILKKTTSTDSFGFAERQDAFMKHHIFSIILHEEHGASQTVAVL